MTPTDLARIALGILVGSWLAAVRGGALVTGLAAG